jgi:hypothetical protein
MKFALMKSRAKPVSTSRVTPVESCPLCTERSSLPVKYQGSSSQALLGPFERPSVWGLARIRGTRSSASRLLDIGAPRTSSNCFRTSSK